MKNFSLITIIILGLLLLINNSSTYFLIGLIFILLGLMIILIKTINYKIFNNNTYISQKENCNCQFDFNLNIEEILNNQILIDYYNNPNLFVKNLHNDVKENAEKLLKTGKIKEDIQINIKDGNIYFNGEINFEDVFCYDVNIPYNLENNSNYKKYFHSSFLGGCLIKIRIILVNGFIKLQIGNLVPYEKNTIKKNEYSVEYKNFYTLVSIPIIYTKPFLNIPKKFMNINYQGILNWTENEKKEYAIIEKDLESYYYLNNIKNPLNDKNFEKIKNIFIDKSEICLKNQNVDINYDYETQNIFNDLHNLIIKTKYMTLSISDLNSWKEMYFTKYSSDYNSENNY